MSSIHRPDVLEKVVKRSVLILAGLTLVVTTLGPAVADAPMPPPPPAAGRDDMRATVDPVTVADGTPVKIALTDQLASNTAHAGDRFQFRSLDDVAVDSWVVIPRGSLGEGEVTQAEPAGSNGHPGKIKLQFDWIYGADNLKIRLSDVPDANHGDGEKGAASTATIASYVLLGPIGLFAHNFVHGKDAIVTADQEIKVYVAQTVHVRPNYKLSSTDGFAH
jgi:hypothetical protein